MTNPETRERLAQPQSKAKFLSDITGLPIIQQSLFPELSEKIDRSSSLSEYPYSFNLQLGLGEN